jgi:hypothetical protein
MLRESEVDWREVARIFARRTPEAIRINCVSQKRIHCGIHSSCIGGEICVVRNNVWQHCFYRPR